MKMFKKIYEIKEILGMKVEIQPLKSKIQTITAMQEMPNLWTYTTLLQ